MNEVKDQISDNAPIYRLLSEGELWQEGDQYSLGSLLITIGRNTSIRSEDTITSDMMCYIPRRKVGTMKDLTSGVTCEPLSWSGNKPPPNGIYGYQGDKLVIQWDCYRYLVPLKKPEPDPAEVAWDNSGMAQSLALASWLSGYQVGKIRDLWIRDYREATESMKGKGSS